MLFRPNVKKLLATADFDGLVRALQHKNEGVQRRAAEALAQLRDPRAVPSLIEYLRKHRGGTARTAVAMAIEQLADAKSLDGIIAFLDDPWADPDVKVPLVRLLGRIRGGRVVATLLRVMAENTSGTDRLRVRDAAKQALDLVAGIESTPVFVAALESASTRSDAAEVLDKLGWQPGSDTSGAYFCLALNRIEECVNIGPAAIPPLLACRPWGTEDRVRVARALALLGESKGIEILTELLEREGVTAPGRSAAKALTELGWTPAADAAGAYYRICTGQFDECARIGVAAVKPLVRAAAQDESIRAQAAATLARLGQQAVEPLTRLLKESLDEHCSGDDPFVVMIVDALVSCSDSSVVTDFIDIVTDENASDSRVPPTMFVRAARGIVQFFAAHSQTIPAALVQQLAAATKNRKEHVRVAACVALAAGGERAVPFLIPALGDPSAPVRDSAKASLLEIGEPAIEGLVAALPGTVSYRPERPELRAVLVQLGSESPLVAEALTAAWERSLAQDGRYTYGSVLASLGAAAIPHLERLLEKTYDAALILRQLRWEPQRNAAGAQYFIGTGDVDRCLEIGDAAVGPLIRGLKSGFLDCRIACCRVLEQLAPDAIPADAFTALVEAVATEIRHLYSRTREVEDEGHDETYEEYEGGRGSYYATHRVVRKSHTAAYPDCAGIQRLVSTLPARLRSAVKELSGEAKALVQP